jgi:hypothetical protein
MTKLSKKEKKYVSGLIAKKLAEMGVKDEIQMVNTEKYGVRPALNETGEPVLNEEGHPKLEVFFKQQAMNPVRRTIRNLRDQGWEALEAFLAIETKPQQEEALEATVEATATEEGQ